LIVGLATGNGITARHGDDPAPIIATNRRNRRATDRTVPEET
jgi:hypothetical protein